MQYNFLVPSNEEGLVLWRKVNPPKPSPPIFLYFFHLLIPFFPEPSPPFSSKLANKALGDKATRDVETDMLEM